MADYAVERQDASEHLVTTCARPKCLGTPKWELGGQEISASGSPTNWEPSSLRARDSARGRDESPAGTQGEVRDSTHPSETPGTPELKYVTTQPGRKASGSPTNWYPTSSGEHECAPEEVASTEGTQGQVRGSTNPSKPREKLKPTQESGGWRRGGRFGQRLERDIDMTKGIGGGTSTSSRSTASAAAAAAAAVARSG